MNPSTGSPSALPPGRGGLFSAKTSLGLLGIMLLGLVALLGVLQAMTSDEAVPETPPQGIRPKLENVGDGALAGMLPEEARRGLERDLGAWFKAADRSPIRDREAVDEPEWVEHLLSSAVRVPLEGLPGRVFGAIENVPAVLDEPGSHRGRLVRVWGRVEATNRLELETAGGVREALLLRLSAHNGAAWTATCLDRKAPEVGSWVKVHGVFTKLWPLEAGRALHIFSSRPLVASFAPVALTTPRVEWLGQIDDEGVEASQEIEERPFYGMLNYIRTLGHDGYAELRDTDQIQVTDLTRQRAVQESLVSRPANHRLQAVRIRAYPLQGKLVDDGDIPENSGNIDFVFRGFLVVDGPLPVLFYSPFPRATFELDGARLLDVEGFFFKRQWVEQGGKRYWMPMLLVTSMERVSVAKADEGYDWLAGALAVGAFITLIALGVAIYRSRKSVQEFRARQEERKARRGPKASA